MEYSSDWLLHILNDHKKKFPDREIHFISDWDAIDHHAQYPYELIRNSLVASNTDVLSYSFSDEQVETKEFLLSNLELRPYVSAENLAITISATASIFLSLASLVKRGVKKFLVFTPVYYSVIDTLKDFGAQSLLFNLLDKDDFHFDISHIKRIISDNKIEAIILTDPIYSAGIEIPLHIFDELIQLCNQLNCWIICDSTLSGLGWGKNDFFNLSKIISIAKAENFIFIESISKRLLINGIKNSLILASENIAFEIEDYASQVYGGFCIPQIQLLRALYDQTNRPDIVSIFEHNRQTIKDNYTLVETFLSNTAYTLYPMNSGYFTMIAHKEYKLKDIDSNGLILNFLSKHDTFALPSSHFSFSEENLFGFRINLLRAPIPFLSALDKCIRENVELLH